MAGNEIFRYPDWFRDAGYFLISIESGCGVRVRLNRFYKARPAGCAYTKSYEYHMQYMHLLAWNMYVCGPYDRVQAVPCTDLEHDMLFSEQIGVDGVTPDISGYPQVGTIVGTVIQELELVEFYVTRGFTQKLEIGKYYVGIIATKNIISGPQILIRRHPRVPPSLFFVHDAFAAFSDNSGILELPK